MFSKQKIIIGECNQGQKKIGVELGGKFLEKNLKMKISDVIPLNTFNDIKTTNNGYEQISYALQTYQNNNYNTILLGGDHSLGISSVDSLLNIYKDKLSVLWIDAHADINDHITSPSGNLHGMTLSYHHNHFSTKPEWRTNPHKLFSSQLYYFGIRDLDPAEIDLIKKDKIGFSVKPDENLTKFIDNSEYLLVSFDVDALDPKYMDSTGVIAPNGLELDDVKNTIQYIYTNNKLTHLDIMEFNPLLGNCEKSIESLKYIFN
jgi:arginase